jgi:hypothetical protein
MKKGDPLADFAELESVLEQCSKKEHRAEQCAKLRAEVRQHCTRDLCQKQHMSRSSRLALSLLFVVSGVAVLGGGMRFLHSATHAVALGVGAWSIVLGLVLFLGLGTLPGRRPSRGLRLALVLGIPLLVLIGLAAVATHISSFGEFVEGSGMMGALPCCGHALGVGALISGAILLLWRRTDPFSPGLTGALVGLVGGLAGAVSVGLACPSGEGWHLWLGHGITVGLVALLGFIVGRRLLAP